MKKKSIEQVKKECVLVNMYLTFLNGLSEEDRKKELVELMNQKL